MTLTDKNKIFFALIHYILVEQKNVDWILKTSLIDFTGISSLLEEKPYKSDSILDSIVDMVTSIKPYHVQFSHYFEHYQTHQENLNVKITDIVEKTIHMRFDALKSIPDLNIMFDGSVKTLPTGTEYTYGNIVYLSTENKFYIRERDEDNQLYWELINEPIYDDGFYYNKANNGFYKGNNGLLEKYSDEDAKSLMDTHKANRLFYMGLHDSDEIRKELNANFKGLEISGASFDIGKFGYDIFNYDTTDYDSPTIIYDYYFLNNLINDLIIDQSRVFKGVINELKDYFTLASLLSSHYSKVFFQTGKTRFPIPTDWKNLDLDTYKIEVYKKVGSNISLYENYEIFLNDSFIDIFSPINDRDKIYIIVKNKSSHHVEYGMISECSSYIEDSSESLRRKIVYIEDGIEEYELPIPSSLSNSNEKIAIQKVSSKGSRTPILNPEINNLKYVASLMYIGEYEHVSMVSFDYKYLYDKIYTWEDRYGRSNNVVNLYGDKFYRPEYEKDRPSELIALDPLNSLFVYQDDNTKHNIFFNDFKNKQSRTETLSKSYSTITSLEESENGTIESITLSSTDNFDNAPAKVLINSEIMLYNSLDRETNTISELKRSCDGTFFFINGISTNGDKKTHSVGDKAIPIREDEWDEIKRNNVYKNYVVRSKDQKIYDCPSGLKKTSTVRVKKLSTMKLLENVDLATETIKISSGEVIDGESYKELKQGRKVNGYIILPDGTTISKNWSLKINGDSIPFDTIYPDTNSNGYCIEDFSLPEKYIGYGSKIIYDTSSEVYGSITQYINDFSVQMVEGDNSFDIIIENDETYAIDESGEKVFRIVGSYIENDNVLSLGKNVYIYRQALNDVTNDFYQDEIYFGHIDVDNILYRDDGTIYGKVENLRIQEITTQVTIEEELNKHDSILINIHNFKYTGSTNNNW